ncbi:hypothetical protein B0H65DRAFT_427878 [Neurospora tetraspora]|uniref:Protein Zds1 C-terminal domain-containing protein n=1 Tax=Neurospora tetraspora TaxID=94610 RepID=A0AAE0JCQ6_9PEZI|nr:hypothetical protein B0H65DRAFT_427878 [Neurospora tetraspora]
MYEIDDDDSGPEDGRRASRPLSFIATQGDHLERLASLAEEPSEENSGDELRLVRTTSDKTKSTLHDTTGGKGGDDGFIGGHTSKDSSTFPAEISTDTSSSSERPASPLSPARSIRDLQADGSASQFPMTNIDDANDIAQELSNLQALRRISMDVGNFNDPDLLPFSNMGLVQSGPPTGEDDEADPSRLLWVPARVHPELEPTAFKDFLENRVQAIKRRSSDSMLSIDLNRSDSTGGGGLRRKKSMLSRQIKPTSEGIDYVDGAERLQRQRSRHGDGNPEPSLNELVDDPTKAVKKLALETHQEVDEGDIPILPAPSMGGLRRSTKTTYRKSGSIRSNKTSFSKRISGRQSSEHEDDMPPVPIMDEASSQGLKRVQSESALADLYSQPEKSVQIRQNSTHETPGSSEDISVRRSLEDTPNRALQDEPKLASPPAPAPAEVLPVKKTASIPPPTTAPPPVPAIVQTPPTETNKQTLPDRSSTQKADEPSARSEKRPSLESTQPTAQVNGKSQPKPSAPSVAPQPSPAVDEKKTDKKAKEKEEVETPTKSSGWKWFKSDEKDKKKREKEKEREREEQARKAKAKGGDKSHDATRLDVLQSSIEGSSKGRESLVLDRDSIDTGKNEEKKKETKKEKEGFFGGLFGGKKKADKEPPKKKEERLLTPEPPRRKLVPDVDYSWTRFPIIEERAIYRMAHIKLANPRRPLHSQVLLSNFMYSYLAKVQAMHPQLNVPTSPQQRRLEEERKRREAEQKAAQQRAMEQLALEQQLASMSVEQQMAAMSGQTDFNFEYHRSDNGYGEASGGGAQYVDDAQIYEYEQQRNESRARHEKQQQAYAKSDEEKDMW